MLKIVKNVNIYARPADCEPLTVQSVEVEIEAAILNQALQSYLIHLKLEVKDMPGLAKIANAEEMIRQVELALYVINAKQPGER